LSNPGDGEREENLEGRKRMRGLAPHLVPFLSDSSVPVSPGKHMERLLEQKRMKIAISRGKLLAKYLYFSTSYFLM
jgi:hypothetical protein